MVLLSASVYTDYCSVLDRIQRSHLLVRALEMESIQFAVKLIILICLWRIPGVMAEPTNIPNSVLTYYSDTGDEFVANTNTSSTSETAQFSM